MTTTTAERPRVLRSPDVSCPVCAAQPGAKCTGARGHAVDYHPARRDAAKAATAGAAAPAAEPHHAIVVDAQGTAELDDTEDWSAPDVPALPTDPRAIATQLLTLAVLEAKVAAVKSDLRAAGYKALRVGESVVGCLDTDDDDPVGNGTALGKVSKAKGATSWKVTDATAFLAWVKAHAPTEVVTTEKVRDSYVPALLAKCKKDGGWVDPDTAELLVPDGVEYSENSPTVRVNLSEHAEQLVAAAVAAGRLRADGTLALPAGAAA